jgi:3-hydroxyacyl-[acyl-carrier-protein] dehydratase
MMHERPAWRELLPWRHPFLMIDRMVDCRPNERILTSKHITEGDPSVSPESGCFPDVLLLEALGQSAALLFRLSYPDEPPDALPLLGFVRASWLQPARVGDEITFDVRSLKMTRTGGVFEGVALRDAVRLAEAELAFASSPTAASAESV